jgi:hypothetical protein
MALTRALFNVLKERLKPGKLASMGYPDIICPDSDLESVLGSKIYSIKRREDSERICRRHNIKDRKIVDSRSFFEALDIQFHVFDIAEDRGEEILCDLNFPLEYTEAYDFVIDVGTLEHCFNIGQALINMAGLVKVDGFIFHENPFNWGNHGFYGLNPTLFHDFYHQNGFEVSSCQMVGRNGQTEEAELTRRFILTGAESNIVTVAKRLEVREFSFPVQSKYKKMMERAA